jgi:glyoxylase-like metal-dependent hydrolase (beta-lactamase superfamily II)
VTFVWERLTEGVSRCRLPFLDVTVGIVYGRGGAVLIDSGTTLADARAIGMDVHEMADRDVTHIVLTHNHFDHVLGTSAFEGAEIYGAPEIAATMVERAGHLRDDAIRYGADVGDVDRAIAALRVPDHQVRSAVIDLGDRTVSISHPGRGHTDHDLIAVVTGADRPVVFCGDLVEESGAPSVDADSDLAAWPTTLERVIEVGGEDAVFVPGHGAVVDAAFVRRQQDWLRGPNVTNFDRRT